MFKLITSTAFGFLFFFTNAQVRTPVYYKYNNAKTLWENYNSGYADTFSAYGNSFRVRLLDTSYDAEDPMALEKLTTKWTVVDYFNRTSHFSLSQDPAPFIDINFDGYNDFLVEERWFYLVFLYNPLKNTFVKSGFYQYDSLPQKIAGYPNLYFDYWGFKFDNWWSYLYTVKDYERINLGIIELKVKVADYTGKSTPVYISIRKIKDDGDEDTEIIKSNIAKFDVKKYWQAHIKIFYNKEVVAKRRPNLDWPTLFEPIK